ncbi:MAG TPA: hypothetical protein VM842_08315 [Nitrospira sp.]|jgi:hypothetical protein|nr:hypothetical protein [Nitrospira sp.]
MSPLHAPSPPDKQSPVRTELVEFVLAAEKVLSPALGEAELTQEECDLIATYVENLSQARHPWGKCLRIKYA